MIDAARLDTTYVHPGPCDARAAYAIARHYVTGEPVEEWLRENDGNADLSELAGRADFDATYFRDAAAHLDTLYQMLLDHDAVAVIGYRRDGLRRYVVAFMTPGGLRCRDAESAAQPISPLTDLAALGDIDDALLCVVSAA